MIQDFQPTSKLALKRMCLSSAKGDLDKAMKLYDFMAKDMDELPMFDPTKPTIMQQVKNGANDTFQWLNQNADQIFLWVDVIQSLILGRRRNVTSDNNTVKPQPIKDINK